MNRNIVLNGVSTHNLKDIDVEIPLNKITVIYGRSGAGKTSLAFSSLYQLCKDEFDALEQGYFENNDYTIKDFKNLIPAVAIQQRNTNNNPRSTLYSFLNIAHVLQPIIANTNYRDIFPLLKINKFNNVCPACNGLGESVEFQVELAIDKNKTIAENPFIIWKYSKSDDYYYQLLLSFCSLRNININTPFYKLSIEEQNDLLYYHGDDRLIFKAKYAGKSRQRRDVYKGVCIFAKNNPKLTSINNLSSKSVCSICHGSRVNQSMYQSINLGNLSFINFLITPFDELIHLLPKNDKNDYLKKLFSSCVV